MLTLKNKQKINTFVQSPWIERNNSNSKALSDPKITSKYSIAELLDVLCGYKSLPEKGLFCGLENAMSNLSPPSRSPPSVVENTIINDVEIDESQISFYELPSNRKEKDDNDNNRSEYFMSDILESSKKPKTVTDYFTSRQSKKQTKLTSFNFVKSNGKENKRNRPDNFREVTEKLSKMVKSSDNKTSKPSTSSHHKRRRSTFFGDLGVVQNHVSTFTIVDDSNENRPNQFDPRGGLSIFDSTQSNGQSNLFGSNQSNANNICNKNFDIFQTNNNNNNSSMNDYQRMHKPVTQSPFNFANGIINQNDSNFTGGLDFLQQNYNSLSLDFDSQSQRHNVEPTRWDDFVERF